MSPTPAIKGWCPGAYRPMPSGDGLVVRVRPRAAYLSAVHVRGLADLSEQYGDGTLGLTSRANLQFRGVREESHPPLIEGLDALGLLDADAEAEARRNIVIDPFRSSEDDGGHTAHTALAEALTRALAAPDAPSLPVKFGFIVDVGPEQRHLSDVSGDIRIERGDDGLIVRADGETGGHSVDGEAEAVAHALALASWFVSSGGIGADGRGRMRRHLAAGARLPASLSGNTRPVPAAPLVRPGPYRTGFAVGSAFGQFSAAALRWLAGHAGSGLRPTPFRLFFLPDVRDAGLFVHTPELIVRPDDPLRHVLACPGRPACSQAQAITRAHARAFMDALKDRLGPDDVLHISGCEKGCAHPKPARLTLVGRNGQFDLVENGRPWDQPARRGLAAPDVEKLGSE